MPPQADRSICPAPHCNSGRLHPECPRQRCRRHCLEAGGCEVKTHNRAFNRGGWGNVNANAPVTVDPEEILSAVAAAVPTLTAPPPVLPIQKPIQYQQQPTPEEAWASHWQVDTSLYWPAESPPRPCTGAFDNPGTATAVYHPPPPQPPVESFVVPRYSHNPPQISYDQSVDSSRRRRVAPSKGCLIHAWPKDGGQVTNRRLSPSDLPDWPNLVLSRSFFNSVNFDLPPEGEKMTAQFLDPNAATPVWMRVNEDFVIDASEVRTVFLKAEGVNECQDLPMLFKKAIEEGRA